MVPGVPVSVCVGLLLAQEVAPAPAAEEMLAAFGRLDPGEQREVAEWFASECRWRGGFQNRLERFVLEGLERDPYAWPAAQEPPLFDPKVHAPAQPIPRAFVDESKPRHARVVERTFRKVPERELDPAFVYDWARRTVVRRGDPRDPARVVANGAKGFAPLTGLVEAAVEMRLDDGAHAEGHRAFGHAYADREGNAYPSITLYDAWASGAEIEMPDVECLALVHVLRDDWRTWTAPVPASEHRRLYATIGEEFLPLRRHRGLRTALARTYVTGRPVLRDGYVAGVDRLHAFWERDASDPAALAERLPDGHHASEWIEEEGRAVDTDAELWARATARRDTLVRERERVRSILAHVLRRMGAFERATRSDGDAASDEGGDDEGGDGEGDDGEGDDGEGDDGEGDDGEPVGGVVDGDGPSR